MDFHPTSFFILENVQLGTFWVGQAKMVLDECGFSLLPAVTRGELVQKLETICIDYTFPSLDLVSINKNGSLPFYGVERWISKLRYKINKEPKKYKELRKLLTAGWHQDDFTDNSTLNVLHVKNERDLGELYKRLIKDWEARGMRCLNTHTCKTRAEKYQDKKKDPDFLKAIGRKKVLRQMEKTGKLPKPETLAKYDIKDEEIKECMGPKGIIYKITSPSGKAYMGQTMRSFEQRIKEHKMPSSGCPLIKRAIDKYGGEMKYEIIEDNIPHKQLDEREIYWIKELNSLAPNGYNCNSGGQLYQFTQEVKDRVRDGLNKAKIDKDGYLGGPSQRGNLFYPRIRPNHQEISLSTGGFKTKEECIEVLKEYTNDPENFTIIDNRRMRRDGSITKQGTRWRVSYKSTYLGTHKTEDKAHEVLEKYLKEPENFPIVKRNVGNIVKCRNKWELRYKHKYIGAYDTENEAQEALERYKKNPENFIKPEVQIKYGSVYPIKNRWALAYKGKYITSYETEKEAREALERYREDPDSFIKPQKKIGSVSKLGNGWRLTHKHKYLGSYPTREEAEEARQALQSS